MLFPRTFEEFALHGIDAGLKERPVSRSRERSGRRTVRPGADPE
jgi:hypothetical protein